MKKAVYFTLYANGKSEIEVKEKISSLVVRLQNECVIRDLVLREGKIFQSCRLLFSGDEVQARCDLLIEKTKSITYDGIYEVVNSIQPTYYKIGALR